MLLTGMAKSPESVTNYIDLPFKILKLSPTVSSFKEQEKISNNNMNSNDQYDQDLTCMIEGCDAIGEEPIVLLDDNCLSDVDAYGEYDDSHQRDNFKNNEREDLIPVVVCGKHFDEIIEAYCSKNEPQNYTKTTK
jgi:hypothetical protein